MLCTVVNWAAWTPGCNLEIKEKSTIYCLAFMLFMLVNWAAWTPVLFEEEPQDSLVTLPNVVSAAAGATGRSCNAPQQLGATQI